LFATRKDYGRLVVTEQFDANDRGEYLVESVRRSIGNHDTDRALRRLGWGVIRNRPAGAARISRTAGTAAAAGHQQHGG
jgi:hypothetical protein